MEEDIHQRGETVAQEDRGPSAGEGIEKSAGLGRGPLDLREDPAINISFNCTSPLVDAVTRSCLLNFSGKANIRTAEG